MSQNLNNFYILVDTEKKIVIDKIQKLPQNWKNISGLPGLSEKELCDLKWAGYYNFGWINIRSKQIKKYSSSQENLELNINEFKSLITQLRKEKQSEVINYQGAKIKSDTNTLYSLFLVQHKEKVNYKCINGYYTFTSCEIKELYDIIETNMQKWFDWEMNVYSQIDECQSISDFINVNYDFKVF
jgi:predicted transcriptional regulator